MLQCHLSPPSWLLLLLLLAAAWLAGVAWLAGGRCCAAGGEGVSGRSASSMSIMRLVGSTVTLLPLLRAVEAEALALIDSSSGRILFLT